jgi:hypothetical protein
MQPDYEGEDLADVCVFLSCPLAACGQFRDSATVYRCQVILLFMEVVPLSKYGGKVDRLGWNEVVDNCLQYRRLLHLRLLSWIC